MMSNPSRVRVSGPLEVFVSGFREDLARCGYTPGAAAKQLQLMAHVSWWLAASGLDAGDLTAAGVQQLVAERRASGRPAWRRRERSARCSLTCAAWARRRRKSPASR